MEKGKRNRKEDGSSENKEPSSPEVDWECAREDYSVATAVEENELTCTTDQTTQLSLHPLLIDEIVVKIFKYLIKSPSQTEEWWLVIRDVQNCRLVCKLWSGIITRAYLKVSPPLRFRGRSRLRIQDYFEVMAESALIPRNRYDIDVGQFTKIQKFLNICGPEATELDLKLFIEVPSSSPSLSHENSSHLNVSKLKSLKITWLLSGALDLRLPSWLQLLLKAAKKLEKLEFTNISPGNISTMFMDAKVQLLPKSLTNVTFDLASLDNTDLRCLTDSKLALDEFSISCFNLSCTNETVAEFFEQQSPTLKVLHLRNNAVSLICSAFPQMKALHHLSIGWQGEVEPVSISDVFPKLLTVDVSSMVDTDGDVGRLLNQEVPSVEEIILSSHTKGPLVEKLAQSFLNVKKLKVMLSHRFGNTKKTLHDVFDHFKDIEELTIHFSDPELHENSFQREEGQGDSFLSGVPADRCAWMEKHGYFKDGNSNRQQPSILSLTKLKKLVLDWGTFDNLVFTDFSVLLTFRAMPSLEDLSIRKLKVSPICLETLRNKLKRLEVKVLELTSPRIVRLMASDNSTEEQF